ncbi:hypothetical protein H1C71_017566 [Ictidomys tridecemlineatus]|nr:hypothetical protein H1C71_017566 [Ictidomys tridecemlineatus]
MATWGEPEVLGGGGPRDICCGHMLPPQAALFQTHDLSSALVALEGSCLALIHCLHLESPCKHIGEHLSRLGHFLFLKSRVEELLIQSVSILWRYPLGLWLMAIVKVTASAHHHCPSICSFIFLLYK